VVALIEKEFKKVIDEISDDPNSTFGDRMCFVKAFFESD